MSSPMAKLAQPTLIHWAVRCSGLATVSSRLSELGWTPTPVTRMSRTPPGRARLEWELFGLHRQGYGGLAPFFIDWLNSPRPTTTSPKLGGLTQVALTAAQPTPLCELVAQFGIEVRVSAGSPRLAVAFASPRGEVRYESADPRGFTLGD